MTPQSTPDLSPELAKRIRLVRRDMSDLLFHFTRGKEPIWHESRGYRFNSADTASHILTKILREGFLHGSSEWTYGKNTICFTEAPIQEFNSIFSLVSIASEKHHRPRYEPYGVAVNKRWLFSQGGRPVIYDHPDFKTKYPDNFLYRFCPYDPENGIDYTWEREWRIEMKELRLDSKHTLVIVPTSAEAFEIVYENSNLEADVDSDGVSMGVFHTPTWLAVSLDMFGFTYDSKT